jgi:hypothetical protein
MPAHIGAFMKLKIFGAFLYANLDQSLDGKVNRRARVQTRKLRDFQQQGIINNPNNRAAYMPWKTVMQTAITSVSARESQYADYNSFRGYLDRLDPALPRGEWESYTDPSEWDLYLRPGTEFDGRCQLYFAARRGPMCVIRHNKERGKLKRIEALPRDGAAVVLWTDAS